MKRIALIIVLAVFGTLSSNAQITKVDQEVFGMDCAPCAYGLERGLKGMDGIEKVRVSLNDGKAYLDLAANSSLSLKQIQEEVKQSGFSAKNAEVVLEGQLVKEDNTLKIRVNKEEYYLTSNTEQSIENSFQPGRVKVRGTVQDEEESKVGDKWEIKVTEIL